ncbi:threonine synthase [Segetibacter sp. 3557_3]|uniref:threonine synthase n=1 Tax=Segetibacter sp. 3557_3 TaxID=2547429 RepID=UPI001058B57A|nr:threonine synthase [Segetibacter sp. 3557_3]TDH28967.1 threonine synthase [Segetibacter sp. 3557_3]
MFYYSTNKQSSKADFREATINGQAPDKGLYFPEHMPTVPAEMLSNLAGYSKEEIAYTVIEPYVGDTISKTTLQKIVSETINFDFPLVAVNENISALELYHGPTLAFKDVGARFMSRCLGHFVQDNSRNVTVLVATSGDTGGAVANGFYDVDGVNVVILYPSGKVSSVQELQLTTLGKNIRAIEVNGTFDDCQQLVKQAFSDTGLNEQVFLTSANSINVARWLPQQFYYFFALRQWQESEPPVICVPSGNFGNICAGLLAHVSGLPVKHFIAACNANDVVPRYLNNGTYETRSSVSTLSNAMDVGNPSNFTRILEMFRHSFPEIKDVLSSISVSDELTRQTLKSVLEKYDYLTDPHGAVGYYALEQYLQQHPGDKGIFLETAHPIKFYDVVEPITEKTITKPDVVTAILKKTKMSFQMANDYSMLKDYLVS